jgi:hypothetical protein
MRIWARVAAIACVATTLVAAESCFSDSCACVTVPNTHEERWLGVTPFSDSIDLSLTVVLSDAAMNGTGIVRRVANTPLPVTVTGAYSLKFGSPTQLTITGWYAAPVTWTPTIPRVDTLYGIVHLPQGTRAGDTLGVVFQRRY